jgi:hypothetical protein
MIEGLYFEGALSNLRFRNCLENSLPKAVSYGAVAHLTSRCNLFLDGFQSLPTQGLALATPMARKLLQPRKFDSPSPVPSQPLHPLRKE